MKRKNVSSIVLIKKKKKKYRVLCDHRIPIKLKEKIL